jgi:GDP/UDP-N,N'-diacetylbacillosamine 2-epimerase (hydrolysing)
MTEAAPRRIVYLSGTRADFGLMVSTLQRMRATPGLAVQVAVTGMHLSAQHGHTVDEVAASGLEICARIPYDVATRTGASMAEGIAACLHGVTLLLQQQRPDALLVLGDRGEMLAGAIAALHVGVPCVHVHGGERSGTVDEPVRHAISKLSSCHFVATEGARERLQRMGEDPARIFVTGAPGLDGLQALGAADRQACLAALRLPVGSRFLLALFHPVVQQAQDAGVQAGALLRALAAAGLPVLWLEPNADAGSLEILRALDATPLPPGSRRLRHLPRAEYVAALRHCEALVGNSSSGVIEAASFGTPVVNVGDRQRMREHGPNVVDVVCDEAAIRVALRQQLGQGRYGCDNAWGDGQAGERIAQLLATLPLDARLLDKINTY